MIEPVERLDLDDREERNYFVVCFTQLPWDSWRRQRVKLSLKLSHRFISVYPGAAGRMLAATRAAREDEHQRGQTALSTEFLKATRLSLREARAVIDYRNRRENIQRAHAVIRDEGPSANPRFHIVWPIDLIEAIGELDGA